MACLIASPDFALRARHPDHPNAFTRQRSLPLPALVASLLTTRGSSQQGLLGNFLGAPGCTCPALSWLNDQLLARVQTLAPVARWHGLLAGAMPDDVKIGQFSARAAKAIGPTGELEGFGAMGFGAKTALELGDRHAVLELHSVQSHGALRSEGAPTLLVG